MLRSEALALKPGDRIRCISDRCVFAKRGEILLIQQGKVWDIWPKVIGRSPTTGQFMVVFPDMHAEMWEKVDDS